MKKIKFSELNEYDFQVIKMNDNKAHYIVKKIGRTILHGHRFVKLLLMIKYTGSIDTRTIMEQDFNNIGAKILFNSADSSPKSAKKGRAENEKN